MAEMSRRQQQHALAIPAPVQGHLNPMMRLCKSLASQGFTITFLNIDPIHHRIVQLQQEQPQISDDDEDEEQCQLHIRKAHLPVDGIDFINGFKVSLQQFSEALQGLSEGVERVIDRLNQGDLPVTCLISDLLMTGPTQKVADKLNMPRVVLFSSCQGFLLLHSYLLKGEISTKAVLDVVMKKNESTKREVFRGGLAGLPVLREGDLPHFRHIHDDTEYMYGFMIRQWQETNKRAHAVVVNSFEELEGPAFEALQSQLDVPILPVGPLLQHDSTLNMWKEDTACLEWLDRQAPNSVLYISFGSITLLSECQFEEIVSGLLSSQQRFLWVLRSDLVITHSHSDFATFLSGFLSKSNDRGCVVTWAPQLRVLSHPSLGGFLTHCGWNSTIEAISHGVPMLCWPYFADQFLIASYIVEQWKVGLRFEATGEDGGFIKRDEVERAIRDLMEGEKGKNLRKNAIMLKEAGLQSVSPGGTSHKNIQTLIQSLKDRPQHICQ